MNPAAAVDVATRIALRLTRSASWNGAECSWLITGAAESVDVFPPPSVQVPAEGHLYSGTSGIGFFLLEVWKLTGEQAFIRTAEGAFQRARTLADRLPPGRAGFYAGRTGIGYAFAQAALATDSDFWAKQAKNVVEPLAGLASIERSFDLVTGAAGAVVGLLKIAEVLGEESVRELASRFADELLVAASRDARGWSWPSPTTFAARNLTGFAHGAAGIAHGLIEAYRATGDLRYRYGAEQAFGYERVAFDSTAGNWPDYRSLEASQALRGGRERLRSWFLEGRMPRSFVPSFMAAWCHGAAGIGLTRLHAYRTLGEDVYRDEAIAAVRTTTASLSELNNYSLCHGVLGNCETLRFAQEILGDEAAGVVASELAERAGAVFELGGRPWPTGVMGRLPEPSLMLGDAGIGYFFLRLASESVPSLLVPMLSQSTRPRDCQTVSSLRDEDRRRYFARTLRVLSGMGHTEWLDARDGERELPALIRQLECAVNTPPSSSGMAPLRECFDLEELRYRLELAGPSRFEALASDFLRTPPTAFDWGTVRFSLAPNVRTIVTNWNWDAWDETAALPDQAETVYLLYPCETTIALHAIGLLPGIIFRNLSPPPTLAELVKRVHSTLRRPDLTTEDIWAKVRAQLESAYSAGLLVISLS